MSITFSPTNFIIARRKQKTPPKAGRGQKEMNVKKAHTNAWVHFVFSTKLGLLLSRILQKSLGNPFDFVRMNAQGRKNEMGDLHRTSDTHSLLSTCSLQMNTQFLFYSTKNLRQLATYPHPFTLWFCRQNARHQP